MNVFTLLSLPSSSKGFSLLPTAHHDGSGSPPRKARRLDSHDTTQSPSSAHRSKGPSNVFTGAVRITITGQANIRKPSVVDSFKLLRGSIRTALDRENPKDFSTTYERIYAACAIVVRDSSNHTVVREKSNYADSLLKDLQDQIGKCVVRLKGPYLAGSYEGLESIQEFNNICSWYEGRIRLLEALFTPLDELYIPTKQSELRIRQFAYTQFTQLLDEPRITTLLNTTLSTALQKIRKDEMTRSLVQKCSVPDDLKTTIHAHIEHLRTHGRYELFEGVYVTLSERYYEKEGNEVFEVVGMDSAKYFEYVVERMKQERERSGVLLEQESTGKVLGCVEQALVVKRAVWVATALPKLIETNKLDQLKLLNELFYRLGPEHLDTLRRVFRDYVKTEVATLVTDKTQDSEMISRLVSFRHQCNTAALQSLLDCTSPNSIPDQRYHDGLLDGLREGFKARRSKPAELLAKRLDELLRKGSKGDEVGFWRSLNDVIQLCRHTDDKDVLKAYYLRALAKRLLVRRSASDEDELRVLDLLNNDVPDISAAKNYFKDITFSKELNDAFHTKHPTHTSLTVNVLQQGNWPFIPPQKEVTLPHEMRDALAAYITFYKAEKTVHSTRKLIWNWALFTAVVTARFKTETKELSVSVLQALVLLLFNDTEKPTWSWTEIKGAVDIEEDELKRTLQSLACGKKRVLKKVPAGRDVNENDEFQFNADFQDPRARVHINSIQVKETAEEHQRTESSIQDDRKHYLDAAIVRIMKAKKELTYEQLKTETIESVRRHFMPEVQDIKKRVEALTEQEYIERKSRGGDDRELNVYMYVA